jgi:nitroimidazol reductase NimA-like FMN-containing flavoprotein (pyridoxamine 5'-phosphate oxidase superfamily)
MTTREPDGKLDPRFSDPAARPAAWDDARKNLEKAEVYWLTTVRSDGRPHVTPLLAVWLEDALHFCTGADEQKARNLAQNRRCVLTTGCNSFKDGFDLVVEGEAVQIRDEDKLRRLAGLWQTKFDWPWTVRDGRFHGEEGNVAEVYEVKPDKVLGFGKGDTFSQTRWRF